MNPNIRPWPALWALVIGFFMTLIDATIVSVANPTIMEKLNTDINLVIWATSAYLLTYAVPLLVTGRLGDRFGPKNIYMIGLVIFTLASAWCGFSPTIGMLIAARAFQGLGAALMSPQTMAVIARIFPPDKRGQAMGIWGGVAGVATLVGPILGGLLVGGLGWEWIFFVNVPIGVVAVIMCWKYVPALPKHGHKFDILGVILSGVGMFLVVFGIQEGEQYDWGTIAGPISVWGLIITGLVVLVAFVFWQRFNKGEPLLPLKLFKDRNFSVANSAVVTVGFTVTSLALPLMFFFQLVYGFTPIESALMMTPMAVLTGVLSPAVGKIVDRVNPKYVALVGLLAFAVSLGWFGLWLDPDVNLWPRLLLPSALLGVGNACVWSPISSLVTYNLPQKDAGAGSGVYNMTRQIGAVLGSAAIAVFIDARLAAELPKTPGGGSASASGFSGTLPEFLHDGFTTAMAQTMLLPAAVIFLGAIVSLFFARPKRNESWRLAGSGSTQEIPVATAAGSDAPEK